MSLRSEPSERAWINIPPNTAPTYCRGCGAMVYIAVTPNGAPIPVDVHVTGGRIPHPAWRGLTKTGVEVTIPAVNGRGVSHDAMCSNASSISVSDR